MRRKWTAVLLAVGIFAAWVLRTNTALEVSEWNIESCGVPVSFDGFRIAQVSDLHNTGRWPDAVAALKKADPDLIVLTGDLVDSRKTDVDMALDFVQEAVKIAPCYYVPGNHEARIREWTLLRQGLLDAGVRVLENEKETIERNGETVTILGLMDPDFGGKSDRILEKLAAEEEYTLLLSHRPELFEVYADAGVDLVFSGHAHGGQFRIPFVGGLVAPHQGFFPKYDAGLYEAENTAMLVSRGVGNSICPIRFNNRTEIIVAVIGTGFSDKI